MTYTIDTVDRKFGRPCAPVYLVRGDYRTFRAMTKADADYLAHLLNNATRQQHIDALEAATCDEPMEVAAE